MWISFFCYVHFAKITRSIFLQYSLNSKQWKSQPSLEWLFGSIEKIDISIYKEWKSLIFCHTSKISNCKEWSFTLQRVKFQSFKSEIVNLFIECSLSTISLDWSELKSNTHKRESLEMDINLEFREYSYFLTSYVWNQGNLKREFAVAAILPSNMEVSYCTSLCFCC